LSERNFEYAEDYTAEELAQLDWRYRLLWLDEFVVRHGLGTWLNDIRGTIGFLRDDQHFSQLTGWAALTDGSILEAIQTGWHLYADDSIAFTYASAAEIEAARGWGAFFRQLRENPDISEDRLVKIRLIAEQMGATYGYTLAQQRYQSADLFLRCKIRVFAYAADAYRSMALMARRYGIHRVDVTGVTDPRTSWPALSLVGQLTTPVALAFYIGAALFYLFGPMTAVTS
jgi:hypothetical protein